MYTLILSRERFEMPVDGWYQIARVGECPHSGVGGAHRIWSVGELGLAH